MNLGYACINTHLGKKRILGGRTCRKATFQQQGLRYVGDLAFQNLNDIRTIIEWNIANDIYLYRMPSDIFPWMSEYEFEDLPQYANICAIAQSIGRLATEHNVRLTFHPGPFNILASNKPDVVRRTMKELRQHSQIFDLMGFEPSHYNSINIHLDFHTCSFLLIRISLLDRMPATTSNAPFGAETFLAQATSAAGTLAPA